MLEETQTVVKKFARAPKDTGSPEVQVALISNRIQHLTEHFKAHKNDVHGRRGLMALVAQRRSLLDYLKRKDLVRYQDLIKTLDIRK